MNIVDCGVPDNVTDGTVTFGNTTYESVATYACLVGYNMSGDPEAHCHPDGQWNGTRICIIVGMSILVLSL